MGPRRDFSSKAGVHEATEVRRVENKAPGTDWRWEHWGHHNLPLRPQSLASSSVLAKLVLYFHPTPSHHWPGIIRLKAKICVCVWWGWGWGDGGQQGRSSGIKPVKDKGPPPSDQCTCRSRPVPCQDLSFMQDTGWCEFKYGWLEISTPTLFSENPVS